jgi:hypothetical protein
MFLHGMHRRRAGTDTPSSPIDEAQSEPEPRWPAVLAGLAVGGLFMALPESLSVGPRWLLLVVVITLQIPLYISRRRNQHDFNQVLGQALLGVITLFLVWSLGLLIHALPLHKEQPVTMLRSAVALWVTNVIVFASWYWRLDGGGPHERDMRLFHCDGAFLFPQMTLDSQTRAQMGEVGWSPQFVDYLFLAFNTSTALSPADTAVLSRWAKVLMMIQAAISLAVVALLAARAVNIL